MEPTRTDETRQPDSAERSRRRAAQEIADGYAAALKRLEPALAEVLAVNQELETLDSRVRGEFRADSGEFGLGRFWRGARLRPEGLGYLPLDEHRQEAWRREMREAGFLEDTPGGAG